MRVRTKVNRLGAALRVTTDEASTEAPLDAPETEKAPPVLNWQDQDDLLRELWTRNLAPPLIAEQLGRSVAAIMTRAVRLGLPRRTAPGRKPGHRLADSQTVRTVPPRARPLPRASAESSAPGQLGPRICLMCLNKFQSEGRHNRICSACKGTSDYAAGSSIPDINYRVES